MAKKSTTKRKPASGNIKAVPDASRGTVTLTADEFERAVDKAHQAEIILKLVAEKYGAGGECDDVVWRTAEACAGLASDVNNILLTADERSWQP